MYDVNFNEILKNIYNKKIQKNNKMCYNIIYRFIFEGEIVLKYRKEEEGLHLFDRKTGLHILLDEIKFKEIDISPRVVSIAITNRCNLKCEYCYNIETKDELEIEYLKKLVKKLDELNCLEITIGGGEPLLYNEILEFCSWTWENTNLGVNITTNGILLEKEILTQLKENISSIRVSLNSLSHKKILENIEYAQKFVNLGINTIFFPDKEKEFLSVLNYAVDKRIKNILIIPLHKNGKFILQEKDWNILRNVIQDYQKKIEIFITSESEKFLKINCLKTGEIEENFFFNISAKKEVKKNSFEKNGILLNNINDLEKIILELKGGIVK